MATGYLELFLQQGETFSIDITLDSLNGLPYNLADYTAKSEIRKSWWSANSTASFATEIYDNGSEGIIKLSLDAPITQNVSSGKYVYDVFITDSTTQTRSKILEGILFVDPSSTKI